MSERPFPWRAALIASLAVNLLVLGGMAGGYAAGLRIDRPHAGDRAGRDHPRGGVLRALPPDERPAMKADLRRARSESRELARRARAARDEVRNAASAETYDAEAVSAAFARMRAADAAMQSVWHETIARALARSDAEHRRTAIEAFIRERTGPLGRPDRHRRERRKDRRPPSPPE